MNFENLITVKELAGTASYLSESTIRWWIFNADLNGLSASLVKIGGRVYIDIASFNEWLDQHRMG